MDRAAMAEEFRKELQERVKYMGDLMGQKHSETLNNINCDTESVLEQCIRQIEELLLEQPPGPFNNEGRALFGRMVDLCSQLTSPSQLTTVLLNVSYDAGLADLFRMMLYSDNPNVRKVVSNSPDIPCYLFGLIVKICLIRQNSLESDPTANRAGCLAAACEAGLFSMSGPFLGPDINGDLTSTTAIGLAVYHNQPDLVKFLYKAGAVTNHVLFQLSRHPLLVARSTVNVQREEAGNPAPSAKDKFPSLDDVNAAREIRAFLTHKASRPRSLQNLCVLEVSKHVGWGHVRDANIDQLEIPIRLKHSLRFKHYGALLKSPESK